MLVADVGIGPWHPLLLRGEWQPPHPMIMPVPTERPRATHYSPEQARARSLEAAAIFRANALIKIEAVPSLQARRTRTKAELDIVVERAKALMSEPGAKLKVVAEIVGVSAGYLSVLLNREAVTA